MYPNRLTMIRCQKDCPIWHFVDEKDEVPKATCDIIMVYHGLGGLRMITTVGSTFLWA